ncbi:hypothetical protein AAVH_09598 [Aphelenchoides avenae]|nr:hypothetical protein AAVH_09598 [Aphelenchus avenae]
MLLVYAILQLFEYVVMLAFCLVFTVIGVTPHNPLVMIFMVLSHVVDLLYLSRPICLLATSLIARRTYLKFYGFVRDDSSPKPFTRISVVLPTSE